MTKPLATFKLRLTTLSPLYIGAGEEHNLSPYSDYVQRGDTLIYLDTGKLQEAMQGDAALVNAFVTGMRQFDNNRPTFELERFITEIMGRKVDDFASRCVHIEGDCKKAHIRRFVATAGKPFIPGSSLKGAIRTAVLVDWLLNRKDGEPELDKIWNILNTCINKKAKFDAKEALGKVNPEQACFGPIEDDLFRHLRVSDSEPIDVSHLLVGGMKRVALPFAKKKGKEQSKIPQWSEMIGRSVETTLSLSMTQPAGRSGFSFLDNQSVPELFPIVSKVSRMSCRHELSMLRHEKTFRAFTDFYKELDKQLESLNSHEAIIRLGGGKTWFDNSIGLAIDRYEFGPFELFVKYIDLLLHKDNLPFPSTRSAIVNNDKIVEPTGWVKLTLL